MDVLVDDDVKAVLEFMQSNVPASKLMNVADGVAKLARLVWEHHRAEGVSLVQLRAAPISDCDQHKQSFATEPRPAA